MRSWQLEPRNKGEDTFQLAINFTRTLKVVEGPLTKRKMLTAINSIFDLLGIAAPIVMVGKILYSKVCPMKKYQKIYKSPGPLAK